MAPTGDSESSYINPTIPRHPQMISYLLHPELGPRQPHWLERESFPKIAASQGAKNIPTLLLSALGSLQPHSLDSCSSPSRSSSSSTRSPLSSFSLSLAFLWISLSESSLFNLSFAVSSHFLSSILFVVLPSPHNFLTSVWFHLALPAFFASLIFFLPCLANTCLSPWI